MPNIKFLLVLSLFILTSAKVIEPSSTKLTWLNLEEVSSKIKDQPKPVIIDIYTNWCHWCKVMDKTTYGNEKVGQYINEHFYAAKVDAESKENLKWRNNTYPFNEQYRVNEFALYATNGQVSFPTTLIIPDENAAPIPIAGFMDPKEIEPILKYFGEGNYKTKTFTEFQKDFKPEW